MTLNVQDAQKIQIPEGEVRCIHDKDNRLLWGRLEYDTKYEGDAWQQTYSGKNLFHGANITSNGITYVWNGNSVAYSGTPTASWTWSFLTVPVSLPAGKYVFSANEAPTGTRTFLLRLYDASNNFYDYGITAGNTSVSFTTSADCTGMRLSINGFTVGTYASGGWSFQLESGSSATEMEPYVGGTPAPNPDYPQDIKVVEGPQSVTISDGTTSKTVTLDLRGVNMFSFDAYGTFHVGGNVTQTHTDNTVHMVATGTVGAQLVRTDFGGGFDSSKIYTISCKAKKIVKGVDGQPRLRIYIQYSDDGSSWASQTAATIEDPVQGQEYTLSASFSGHPYYRFYFYNNASTPVTIGEETEYWDIQVEEGDTATDFQPYHAPYKLAKAGAYSDYFYKDGSDWKLKKQVGKVTLNGSETITLHRNTGAVKGFRVAIGVDIKNDSEVVSDYFRYSTFQSYFSDSTRTYGVVSDHNDNILQNLYFSSPDSSVTTVAQFSTWLSTHNTTAYYVLATPTDTIVTDTTLIAQLNAISEWMNRYGYQATVSGDLPIVINQESL